MRLKKFIYIELWKMMRNHKILAFLLVETIAIAIPLLDPVNSDVFSTTAIYLSPYMGISLTFRFIYSSMIVSDTFSKDIERGILNAYIAGGISRKKILYGKILCVYLILSLCTLFSLILYTCVNFEIQGLFLPDKDYFVSILLTIIPLLINVLFLFIVDGIFGSSFITVFTAIAFVVVSSFVPHDIAKWLYISYNNPITVILYQKHEDILCMILTFIGSFVIFSILIYQLFTRRRS